MNINKLFNSFLIFLIIFVGSDWGVLADSAVTLSAIQNSETSFIITAWDTNTKGNIGELTCKVWSAKNSQDDVKTEVLNYADGKYTFQVNISDHNNDKGMYYLELYGSSGLLKSDFATIAVSGNEWTRYVYNNGNFEQMTCRAVLTIEPKIIEKSTEEANSAEDFKSGYGYTATFKSSVISNVEVEAQKALTGAGNARLFFPEFNYRDGVTINDIYGQYNRLTDCTIRDNQGNIGKSVLELEANPFSAGKKRVHFTPIWYPDNVDYIFYADVFDAWSPGGMLSTSVTNTFSVDGTVYDDWQVNQQR